MSKSLKDIVEDGFAKLAVLSDKRKELLAKCEEFSNGSSSKQCQQGVQKLEATEGSYSAEISSHEERSHEVLQQTLAQIVEDNERFLSSVKENLQLRIARVLKDLSQRREWMLADSSEKFDSTVRPLERELEAGTTDLRFEAAKLLGELSAACKRSQSSLHESQAEISGRVSSTENEMSAELGAEFGQLVQEAQRRRKQTTESLEELYGEQSTQMANLTEEMDEKISCVVTQNLHTVKDLGKEAERAFGEIKENVISTTASEIVSLSQESFSELEASYEYSHHELSDKLSELRGQTDKLLGQVNEFLSDLEAGIKSSAESLSEEIKKKPSNQAKNNSRNPIDESLKQLTRELDLSSSDFKRQLNELLKIQSDRLANLCSSAESSISATALALNTELKQLIRLHEQSWGEREQELLARLRKMEKEAQETYALVKEDDADHGETSDEGGE